MTETSIILTLLQKAVFSRCGGLAWYFYGISITDPKSLVSTGITTEVFFLLTLST